MRRLLLSVPALLVIATLSACGGGTGTVTNPPPPPPPPPVQGAMTTVDFGNVHQAIRGFGGAEAWMGTSTVSPAINTLFGTGNNQIGLSILRIRIDPSSTTKGTQWDNELTNATNAIAAGSNVSIIATPWTPPAAWKINAPNPNQPLFGGSLDLTNHSVDYANYLANYVSYAASKGVNLYGISMQNEPDAPVTTYEACDWTQPEMHQWVAQLPAGLFGTTKLIMPESFHFDTSYSDPVLTDPNAAANIGIVAGHLYGASPAAYSNAAGKELWMTEHYLNASASQPTIGDALAAAKEIHDSMAVAQYNAYVWWWAIDWNPGSGVTNTGLVDTSSNLNYFGAAMAQFSRFVRPGYARVDAAFTTPNVFISAYAGNGHSVIVALNLSNSNVSQPFTIQNQTITSLVPYQTTGSAMVSQLSAVSVTGGQFTYTLPAQSITTFLQ